MNPKPRKIEKNLRKLEKNLNSLVGATGVCSGLAGLGVVDEDALACN
jgi:hypothetical protein